MLTVRQIAGDLLGGTGAVGLDDAGRVRHRLTVVDLDSAAGRPGEWTGAAAERIDASAGVVVGVTRRPAGVPAALLDAATVTLTPCGQPGDRSGDRRIVVSEDLEGDLKRLSAAVEQNPASTAALHQVLRAGVRLPVPDALRLESFAYSTLLTGPEFAAWLDRRGPRALPVTPPDGVLVDRRGDTLLITLNHPGRRNAYSAAIRDALIDALDIALADPSLRVELRSSGPDFSSGGDLAEFGTAADPATAHFIRTSSSAGAVLARLSSRTYIRLHGHCVGAGLELPSFAGQLAAAPDTSFRLPEIAMGLIPGAGGTVSIPRRIGRWRAAWLALSGATIEAEQALAWGLVDEISPAAG